MSDYVIIELYNKSKEAFYDNNFELSIEYLEKILFYQGDNYEIYHFIAINRNHLKQYKKAIINLNKAIELNSTDCLIYSERAFSKYRLGLYEESIKDLDNAIKLNNNYL
ncbi:hypothetical protein [Brachyspira hampsonii]|uniref:TPR domain-containing protein n=1 Tax=Brachyspira hampsonii 30446 TaxID=1289135 RepID=A0A2U4EY27_9SPIR|nr:hypothetical protein [Brachyspira hampsonii]EKV58266.1 TPR domain-containing protein [Brachyspira hampsonii 30446]MBW5390667.1 hypothetical protein [Brachyspira hampsonii]MBW5394068.1 hypothetical protein [Brachyspira hampsonii]OEJ17686.1 hypothetical protein A9495_07015 [Brachyspira hampsonii]